MFRRSGWLFLIIFILMILIATPMFILNNSMGEVRDSAKRINDLGFIRGGIQRYTKLKLSNISNSSLEARIDSLLDHYILEE
ncbi:MAG TPA: hypothetical protein VFD57_03575, partial [Clostridia bacterium]|nr:hypothetical protein [Clostridia bacterium]